MRILVVEDDPGIAFLLETLLASNKYIVDVATDGQAGLDLSNAYEYDAIVLDVTLPRQDGIGVCREIRASGNTVPILLLTSLDSPADRTKGLDAGADDYLGKPFDRDELLARLRALLRRAHAPSVPILSWGNLHLDPVSTTVTFGDRLVPVTPKEYALLELFLRNSKRVFSCNAILDHLWSFDPPGEDTIRTHIKGLRHKLKQVGAAADLIETVYGIGYRLKPIDSPGVNLLTETWEKFKGQVHEQVAVLEQLAVRFLHQDLQSDWQTIGKNIAHSLTGSLGTFGFSLSSELARQIEKLLGGERDLTREQGQLLFSLVTALREELDRPIETTDLHSFAPDLATDILLVSADQDLNREIQSMATDFRSERLCQRGWNVQIVPTIAAARSQLHHDRARSILLTSAVIEQTDEVLRLLVEINKQVPLVPIIALTDPAQLDLSLHQLGNWTSICPTEIADLMESIDRAISEAESTQIHVLVVDDDLKILAILRTLLVPWGFKITTLADSQKFWEILPVIKPDLVILDIEMLIVSGLELCQSIRDRSEWSNLPIIFLTAHTEPTLIHQVFAIGADDFITKPVVGPEIIARITNLMERQQVQRLKSAQWQRIDAERGKLATRAKIQAALMAISAAVSADNTLHARQSLSPGELILEQVDLLYQLLLNNPSREA